MLILNVYRPPPSNAETDTSLATCIENVIAQNKECFVLGDLNINTLYVRSRSNRLLKSIHSLGLSPTDSLKAFTPLVSVKWLIKQLEAMLTAQQKDLLRLPHLSTKSTFPTSTILFHVFDVTLSDHYPVFVIRRCNACLRKRKNAHTTINYRSLKNFDQKKFKEDLAQAPWSIIESFDNPSDALDTCPWVCKTRQISYVTEMDG